MPEQLCNKNTFFIITRSFLLGKGNGSAGLYLFNRHNVSLWIADKEYSITINEKMRVQNLGFGINFMESYVFCTVNGVLLLNMKELPPRDKFSVISPIFVY